MRRGAALWVRFNLQRALHRSPPAYVTPCLRLAASQRRTVAPRRAAPSGHAARHATPRLDHAQTCCFQGSVDKWPSRRKYTKNNEMVKMYARGERQGMTSQPNLTLRFAAVLCVCRDKALRSPPGTTPAVRLWSCEAPSCTAGCPTALPRTIILAQDMHC